MRKKIVFWVNPELRRPGLPHIPLLFPFWGVQVSQNSPFSAELFHKYSFDTAYYGLTDDPHSADFLLVPYRNNVIRSRAPELYAAYRTDVERYNKQILVDGTGDIEYPVPVPRARILRTGGYKFLRRQNEIHIPFYADDLLEAFFDGKLSVREKSKVPSVSFAGWATLTPIQRIKTAIKEIPNSVRSLFDERYKATKKGILFRSQVLGSLTRSPAIDPHFIIRGSYSGHVKTAQGDIRALRTEFVDNLYGADYALSVRGDANGSIRLFEALSLGRIPLIIDTECNFPFSEELDYSTFSVSIDFRDISLAGEKLRAFHNEISHEVFQEMQRKAREVYVRHFRIDGLTRMLMEKLSVVGRGV
jgi:hypothetical protein